MPEIGIHSPSTTPAENTTSAGRRHVRAQERTFRRRLTTLGNSNMADLFVLVVMFASLVTYLLSSRSTSLFITETARLLTKLR